MTSDLLARLAGRPMALAPRALDGLLALALDTRGPRLQFHGKERDAAGYALADDGIAVVRIVGPLLAANSVQARNDQADELLRRYVGLTERKGRRPPARSAIAADRRPVP